MDMKKEGNEKFVMIGFFILLACVVGVNAQDDWMFVDTDCAIACDSPMFDGGYNCPIINNTVYVERSPAIIVSNSFVSPHFVIGIVFIVGFLSSFITALIMGWIYG